MSRTLPPLKGVAGQQPSLASTSLSSRSSSGRSGRSCGVAVRPWLLPRQDCLPDRISGKRSPAAPDSRIRIFVRVAGKGGRVAFWVDPELPVGPAPGGPRNRFTDIWGEDAELRGPCAGKVPEDGRLTPLRRLLAERECQPSLPEELVEPPLEPPQASLVAQPSLAALTDASLGAGTVTLTAGDSSSALTYGGCSPMEASLKELIEAATGVPVAHQKLTYGRAGLLDDHRRSLCDCDIGHGALLHLSVRPTPGTKKEQPFLASPRRAREQERAFSFDTVHRFVRNHVGLRPGKIVESLPDWHDSVGRPLPPTVECPQEPYYRNFTTVMHGEKLFDLSDSLRGRFTRTQKVAVANAAGKHLVALHGTL